MFNDIAESQQKIIKNLLINYFSDSVLKWVTFNKRISLI